MKLQVYSMTTLSRRISRLLLRPSPVQLRTYASPSGFKRKTGVRDSDGASDVPGEQPTGRRRRDTVRPSSPSSVVSLNIILGVPSDANLSADSPSLSTGPSQSTHTPNLPPSNKTMSLFSLVYNFNGLLHFIRKQSRLQSSPKHSNSLTMTKTPSGYLVCPATFLSRSANMSTLTLRSPNGHPFSSEFFPPHVL